ncbi:hypothetical protein AOQ73_19315 [Bradyrhizobium pachyrhizi]|nr:hypothetical protein AOQ73_19315 [Bradyrhizobium pachyrhizi]
MDDLAAFTAFTTGSIRAAVIGGAGTTVAVIGVVDIIAAAAMEAPLPQLLQVPWRVLLLAQRRR